MKRISILFVCMGNICRSPLAEGIFSHLVEEAGFAGRFEIDSAGTGSWHQGDHPDRHSITTARGHGIDISRQRARQITMEDFGHFDLILAMDQENLSELRRRHPEAMNVHLFGDIALETGEDIPDPYYGGADDFELVYARLFTGCRKLLEGLGTDNASWRGKISSVR
ncbi:MULTISPECIES: low molecular weight protein-tyrosine-phosphatase [unclassified Rhizobium]|uniref:low molecular weight protein-tyrosine-phosphatase n=1 Tax=unclassified Rhizobium TaxID=2613769 RepID=UPI00161287DB|nr:MULTISPECIES: low molecular weight protein-tyrosine-phosphatase [unclassified Rhizobium]MBB3542743.1 protein-tyrosine phosphatase [Rhizobium sp. BK399]MCS3739543.1 protein-tyrosine phosphatase [Rhizobium sp. BK661]MCS4091251.1 protein-tyrosine phosphatase [Rhizobium sp. BK176]